MLIAIPILVCLLGGAGAGDRVEDGEPEPGVVGRSYVSPVNTVANGSPGVTTTIHRLAEQNIFLDATGVLAVDPDNNYIVIQMEADFHAYPQDKLMCESGPPGSSSVVCPGLLTSNSSSAVRKAFFHQCVHFENVIRAHLATGEKRATTNAAILEMHNIQLEPEMNRRRKGRKKRALGIALFVLFLVVVAVAGFIFASVNRADIDKTDDALRLHIHQSTKTDRDMTLEFEALRKAEDANREDINLIADRFNAESVAKEVTDRLYHPMFLLLTGIEKAFDGSLSSNIFDSDDVWKQVSRNIEAPEKLLYHTHPELLFQLSRFVLTAVAGHTMTGLLFVPVLDPSHLFVRYRTHAAGHFSTDHKHYTVPAIAPTILLPADTNGSHTPIYYAHDTQCSHLQISIIALCPSLHLLETPPSPNVCGIPIAGSCPVSTITVPQLPETIYRHFPIPSAGIHVVATTIPLYLDHSTSPSGPTVTPHYVRRLIDVYTIQPGHWLQFGNHTIYPFPHLSSVGNISGLTRETLSFLSLHSAKYKNATAQYDFAKGTVKHDIVEEEATADIVPQDVLSRAFASVKDFVGKWWKWLLLGAGGLVVGGVVVCCCCPACCASVGTALCSCCCSRISGCCTAPCNAARAAYASHTSRTSARFNYIKAKAQEQETTLD